jgi:hypothetical protein
MRRLMRPAMRSASEAHPWPLEVVNLVWTPPGSKIAAIVEVRAGRAALGLIDDARPAG